jgi:hypothetical protein
VGETIETKIGKTYKAIIIDHVLSNIQANFWKHNTKHGIFSISWNNAIVPQTFIGKL